MSNTCRRGHPWSQANTRVNPNGSRSCRVCIRLKAHERYEHDYRATNAHQHRVLHDRKAS